MRAESRTKEHTAAVSSAFSMRRMADESALEPDPKAHAEILVLTYGLQTAGWIAESNLATARRLDAPYWSRVLQTIKLLRDLQPGS